MLYRIRKSSLLTLLQDYPGIETRMTNIAQSRRRRLAHYQDPKNVSLAAEDEIDAEDCRTDLFGKDENVVAREIEEENDLTLLAEGRRPRNTTVSRRNANITRHQLPKNNNLRRRPP